MSRGVDWIRNRGDTAPPLAHQLTDGGVIIDLTASLAVEAIFFREENAPEVFRLNVTVTNPAQGRVSFSTPSAITDEAALYAIEFLITWPGPTSQRIPSSAATDYRYLLVRTDRSAPAFPAAPLTPIAVTQGGGTDDDSEQFAVVGMLTAQTFFHTRVSPNPNVWFYGTVLTEVTPRYVTNLPVTYPAVNQVRVDPGVLAPLTGTFYID